MRRGDVLPNRVRLARRASPPACQLNRTEEFRKPRHDVIFPVGGELLPVADHSLPELFATVDVGRGAGECCIDHEMNRGHALFEQSRFGLCAGEKYARLP